MLRWMASFSRLMYATKSRMPPSYWKVTLSPSARSSFREIWSPLVRNAVSRRRWASTR